MYVVSPGNHSSSRAASARASAVAMRSHAVTMVVLGQGPGPALLVLLGQGISAREVRLQDGLHDRRGGGVAVQAQLADVVTDGDVDRLSVEGHGEEVFARHIGQVT